MKIKWIGKYTGSNLPAADIPASAKALPEASGSSALLLIPIVWGFALCACCKYQYLGGLAFSRGAWMIGLVIAVLFTPVHELIHALCFPPKSEVFLFYTPQGFGTTCTTPMTRNRFLAVNLLPATVLGLIPLVLFMLVPHTYGFLSTLLCVFSFVHIGCSYVDFLNILHLRKLPKDAMIQVSGAKILWYLS